jgi:hypothetical protein
LFGCVSSTMDAEKRTQPGLRALKLFNIAHRLQCIVRMMNPGSQAASFMTGDRACAQLRQRFASCEETL